MNIRMPRVRATRVWGGGGGLPRPLDFAQNFERYLVYVVSHFRMITRLYLLRVGAPLLGRGEIQRREVVPACIPSPALEAQVRCFARLQHCRAGEQATY